MINNRFYPLLVLALVFFAHAPSLNSGFHYDDQHSLLDNPHIRDLGNLPRFFIDPTAFSANPEFAMYRPLVLVAHALNFAIGDYDPWGYQLLNLAIHCLASLLVYALLLQWPLPTGAAFAGALIFGLHPVQTQAVNFVSSRSESMAALFYLGAFYGYLRGKTLPSLCSFILALLCKATAITLPFTLALYALFYGNGLKSIRRQWIYWLLSIGYIAIYMGLTAPGTGIERATHVRPLTAQLTTQSKAIIHYLQLIAMPVDLNIQQQFFVSESPLHLVPLLSLGVIASLAYLIARARPALLAFVPLFTVGVLSPTLLLPLHILVNDHRLYLAIFAVSLLLASLMQQIRREYIWLICLLFTGLSLQRGQIWQSDITLWQDAVQKAPLMPEAHYNHGYALQSIGATDEALDAYIQATHLQPSYARAQNNLGAIYQQRGQLKEALQAYRIALKAEPDVVETLNNMGLCYTKLGQTNEAMALYRRAVALDDSQAEIWLNLGLLYRDTRQMSEAAQALGRALLLDPTISQRFPAQGKAGDLPPVHRP